MTGVRSAVDELRGTIDGTVAMPGEGAYDTAVSIWNGVIERRPAVVVSCASSGDVVSALTCAQERGLDVSVRGGGHNYAGHALCDGGLMIDLTPMKSIVVNAPGRRVCVAVEPPGGSWMPRRRSMAWPCRADSSAPPGWPD
jgi:FAD/FMN-containing dehydrogenase